MFLEIQEVQDMTEPREREENLDLEVNQDHKVD